MALMTQKPGRSSSRRRSGCSSRNNPTDGSHSTIVYFARMPRPTTRPAAGHAQRLPRKTAWCPSTSAQPQQQVYGASMVMSDDPAATAGSVRASATTPRASVSRRKTCTVRT